MASDGKGPGLGSPWATPENLRTRQEFGQTDQAQKDAFQTFEFGAAAGGPQSYVYTGTGGFTIAGSADYQKGKVLIAGGGITLGGNNTAVLKTKAPQISGGIILAGAATIQCGHVYVGNGGIVINGTAPVVKGKIIPAANSGFTTGGSAVIQKTKVPQISGGIVISGAAQIQSGHAYTGSGGINISGIASVEYEPGETGQPPAPIEGPWRKLTGEYPPQTLRRKKQIEIEAVPVIASAAPAHPALAAYSTSLYIIRGPVSDVVLPPASMGPSGLGSTDYIPVIVHSPDVAPLDDDLLIALLLAA